MGNLESKDMRLWGQLFSWSGEVRASLKHFYLEFSLRIQKERSRNCTKFADMEYLVLNVESRGEKHKLILLPQKQGKKHRTVQLEFGEITLTRTRCDSKLRNLLHILSILSSANWIIDYFYFVTVLLVGLRLWLVAVE